MDEKLVYTFRLYMQRPLLLIGIFGLAGIVTSLPVLLTWNTPPDDLFRDFSVRTLNLVLSIIVIPLAIGAVIHALNAQTRGERPSLGECLRAARARWIRLAVNWFAMGLLSGLGIICFIIPGIVIWVKLLFTPYAIMDLSLPDDIGPLTRSWRLTKGYGWMIFGVGLLFSIPAILIFMAIGVVSLFSLTLAILIQIPLNALGMIVTSPIWVFVFVCYREAVLRESGSAANEPPDLTDNPAD